MIQSYEQSMSELLSGSEHQKVVNGIFTAEEIIEEKVRKLNEEIEKNYKQISEYNASIAEYRKDIRRIEERECIDGRYNY